MPDNQPKKGGVKANCHEHPDRKRMADRLSELVKREKWLKQAKKKIQTLRAQNQGELAKTFCSTPSKAEQSAADWEATVERAKYGGLEHEAKELVKEQVRDEENRRQIEEGMLALAEKIKQQKRLSQSEAVAKQGADMVAETEANGILASDRKNGIKLALPLQFDCAKNVFVDCQKQMSNKVPLRLADVVKAWFAKDPTRKGKLKRELSYAEIGALYIRGRIKKNATATATEADLKFREENFGPGKVQKDPATYATRFASDFTRWLKRNGADGNRLFANDKDGRRYRIVSDGWHPKRPLIVRAEVSKRRAGDRADLED